jgi:uncharacterized Fe-S cluster-containing radical SAM superfamily protein
MFDSLALAEETKRIVCKDNSRKYYRFRHAHFYGGIATADCVGCNLRCLFCWAWNVVTKPEVIGTFYSPQQVSDRLVSIAEKHNLRKVRISGNEPTLVKEHLLSVLHYVPEDLLFILETNGILIGHDKSYATDLSNARTNLHVRVCLKGSSPEEFERLTGAKKEYYDLQFKALEHLKSAGVDFHPAIMTFIHDNYVEKELSKIDQSLVDKLEYEEIIHYPAVVDRLRKAGFDVCDV